MANQMIALQTRNPQLPDPSKMTSQYATMMNLAQQNETSKRQGMQAQQAMDIKAAEEARAIEMQGPALAEAGSKATSAMLKTAMEFNNFVRTALSVADTPDQIPELAARIARQPQFQDEMFQGSLQEAVASLPRDPSQFEAWKEKTALSTLAADKRYEQEFQKQTTGAEERIIAMPKYGRGAATEVPGSRIQAAQGMQYITDDQGNIRAVPKETGGSFGTAAPSMGAPGTGGNTFSRMIRQESGGKQFDRNGRPLTSSAGAIGIAQVMPKTAPEAARLAGLPFDDKRYRTDPEYNLALGKAYYEKQLADFGGDEKLAAAAYNAGPGAVRRALQKGGPNGWINNVPAETRDYVKSVFGGGQTAGTPTGAGGEPPIIVKGSGAKAKPSTEGERRFGTVSQNMTSSMKEATAALLESSDSAAPGGVEYAASLIPFYGDEARKFAQSGPRQRFEGALLALLDGVTYINTGAGTSKTQEVNYKNTYVPTYQDTPKSRKAKLDRAIRFIENSKAAAGVMWTPEIDRELKNLKSVVAKIDFGGGAAPKAAQSKTPVAKAPAGVSAAEWNAMTPAERKLWQ